MTESLSKTISFFNQIDYHSHDFLFWSSDKYGIFNGTLKGGRIAAKIKKNELVPNLFDVEVMYIKNIEIKGLSLNLAVNKANEIVFDRKRIFW